MDMASHLPTTGFSKYLRMDSLAVLFPLCADTASVERVTLLRHVDRASFIGVTPSGASACMSRQEHTLSPEGQRLPQPVGGPSVRDSLRVLWVEAPGMVCA